MMLALLQPDLSSAYLGALIVPVAETLAMTLGAMALAFTGGIIIGLCAVLGGGSGRMLARAFTIFRAVPELTLAILCVVIFGLGPGAGMVALAAYYMASTGKVFADLIRAGEGQPLANLRHTGAGKLSLALYGYLPITARQLLAYGGFAFECALRAAVIIGAVGGGGIGGELVGSLAVFDLHRASTCIIITVGLIMALDRASAWLGQHPRWLWPFSIAGLACAVHYAPRTMAANHSLQLLSGMVPPALPAQQWLAVPQLIFETIAMAAAATFLAALVALPLSFMAAPKTGNKWLVLVMRSAAAGLRAIPEFIWGLVLILWAGIGPLAGCCALFVHSLGSFIRLFADALDATPDAPRLSLMRSGSAPVLAALYAALPQAAPALMAHILFRFEWNMRMATVLGLIGAGGIGQALFEAQQLMFYDQLMAWLLITAGVLLVAEWGISALRGWAGSWAGSRAANTQSSQPRISPAPAPGQPMPFEHPAALSAGQASQAGAVSAAHWPDPDNRPAT